MSNGEPKMLDAAARSAGIRGLLWDGVAAEVPEELGFSVDTTVKGITDLPALLRAWAPPAAAGPESLSTRSSRPPK